MRAYKLPQASLAPDTPPVRALRPALEDDVGAPSGALRLQRFLEAEWAPEPEVQRWPLRISIPLVVFASTALWAGLACSAAALLKT